MANLIPSSKNGSIIKADKFFASSKNAKANNTVSNKTKFSSDNTLLTIEKKVIKIDKLLKDSLFFKKKESEKARIKIEQKSFTDKEKELEKKKPKKEKGVNLPTPPKMGFLDWIKNFITQTFLGFIAVRLIDFLPQLLKIFPVIIKAGDFLINIGGKLLDGLVTFVDWGYKAIDGTRGFIKNLGGEGLAKNFDKFAGTIDNVIEIAILAALATADSGSGGDLLDLGKDFVRDKILKKGAQQAVGGASRSAGLGAGAVAGVVAGAGLLASAVGEYGFQVRKMGIKPIQNLESQYKKDKNPLTKFGRGFALNMVRPLYNLYSAAGFLLDVVGAPFRYAIELLRFPFLSPKDQEKQAYNLAKFDARIREDLRKALNMVTLGFAFKEKGSFGNIYGNKGAQTEMMNKLAGGGKATSSASRTYTRRTLRKKRPARSLSFAPPKIKPGKNVGGEGKIQQVFPNPEKQWWDPLGIFSGGNKQQTATKKPTEKTQNPQEFLVKSNEVLGRSNFFGPFFTLALKSVLGDTPNKLDYLRVSQGLNSWMQNVFTNNQLGFAGGGEVDARQFFSGEDYTGVIAKSVEDSVSKEVDTTIRNLRGELALKKPVGREEMLQENMQKEKEEPSSLDVGPGGTVTGGNADFWTLVAISRMEDSDPQGSADVAQSIYNRVASGVYGGKTIKEIVLRQGQYEPTWKYPKRGRTGVPNPEWHAIKDLASASAATGISKSDLQRTAAALRSSKYQEEARKFVGGRTDFMGGANKKGAEDVQRTTNTPNNFFGWFVGPAAKSYGAKNPGPARAPQLGDIVVMGGGTESLGKGYGSGGSKIAGELGRYIKQKLRQGPDFSQVHRHPEHPPYSLTSGHSRGSLHYQGRAVDIGAYTHEQGPILKVISEFNRMKGVKPVQLLHGKNEPSGHSDHVHVAYEKGGETLDGPHQALIGEKGKEYVIDADSYQATEKVAPGLLDILNYDVKDKASLKKYLPNIIESLSRYTDYENPYSEPEIVYVEVPVEVPVPIAMGGGGNVFVGGVNSNMLSYDIEQKLSQIG